MCQIRGAVTPPSEETMHRRKNVSLTSMSAHQPNPLRARSDGEGVSGSGRWAGLRMRMRRIVHVRVRSCMCVSERGEPHPVVDRRRTSTTSVRMRVSTRAARRSCRGSSLAPRVGARARRLSTAGARTPLAPSRRTADRSIDTSTIDASSAGGCAAAALHRTAAALSLPSPPPQRALL